MPTDKLRQLQGVEREIGRLERERDYLLLEVVPGRKLARIAATLGITRQAVQQRFAAACKRLAGSEPQLVAQAQAGVRKRRRTGRRRGMAKLRQQTTGVSAAERRSMDRMDRQPCGTSAPTDEDADEDLRSDFRDAGLL